MAPQAGEPCPTTGPFPHLHSFSLLKQLKHVFCNDRAPCFFRHFFSPIRRRVSLVGDTAFAGCLDVLDVLVERATCRFQRWCCPGVGAFGKFIIA